MENIKAKEIKDDAIIDIKVNKTFYMMTKSALFTIFKEVHDISKGNSQEFVKNLTSKPYTELNDKERVFYTLTLLTGEIEKQAQENNLFQEKEINIEDLKKELEQIDKSNKD